MKELFQNRVFRVVIAADLLQQIAIWIRNIALLFYVMEQTNSDPVAVSMLTVIEQAPIFLFAFLGGTLADRWNPKKVLMASDMLSAASIAVIMLLIAGGYWKAVFAATLVSAVVSQVSQPASVIIFKKYVPESQVPAAIGLNQSMMSLFMIVGPMIGTLVYSWLGITYSLLCLFALFGASALVQMLLPEMSKPERAANSRIWQEMKEGFRYVCASRNLLLIAGAFSLIGLGVGLIQPLDVFIVTERLQLDKEALQWFYAMSGTGMLIGGLTASATAERLNTKLILFAGIVFLAVSMLVEALSVWVALTAAMRFLVGVMMAFMQIVLSMLLIKLVDETYVGRANGAIAPLMIGGILTGSALSGFVLKSTTLIVTFGIASAIVFAAAWLCLGLKIDPRRRPGAGREDAVQSL
ncbi:Predicted arabinose efflux permease, MFS family [Paenibacillus sp. UNCCL117]|uniref:MFS transporter n=1 Tax=unclassified Paenibacillus TaxID=185978 RepID=UPI0008892D82|nr:MULTISPECIES: MFS transporter [unclassified Paenibacillus]SDD50201.1 Predicted arabinose efflux permease, MFS family [Paenibacillus sp. cl123]SFW49774.1 Predicted arabinose efflux permease, MFS family [Paenibacillus sp. UNCCL117]